MRSGIIKILFFIILYFHDQAFLAQEIKENSLFSQLAFLIFPKLRDL